MYALFAEHVNTHERRFMGGLWLSLKECKKYILDLNDLGTWPEECIAVAVDLNDDMNTFGYFYDHDEWEHCGRMVHETN